MAIIEKGKGKYQFTFDYYENGKRHRKTKVVECGKRELKQLYSEFQVECKHKPKEDTCTVRELLESYIDNCEMRKLSVNTIRGYRVCSKRLNSAFGEVLAKDLTPYMINEFIRSQTKLERSSKTIGNSVSLLGSAYEFAIGLDLLVTSPCSKVKLPKKESSEKKILDEDEVKRFVECLDGITQDDKVAFLLALFAGLRKGEIQGLKEEDIGFDFNTVSITKTRYNKTVQLPKTDTSNRVLRLPYWVMDEVRTLINQHESHDYLIQYCNEPVKEWYLEDRLSKFRTEHNFDITLHGLRHTFASMLIASGEFDIAEISKAMGHASISITLNVYSHLFKKQSLSVKRIADFNEKYGTQMAHESVKAL